MRHLTLFCKLKSFLRRMSASAKSDEDVSPSISFNERNEIEMGELHISPRYTRNCDIFEHSSVQEDDDDVFAKMEGKPAVVAGVSARYGSLNFYLCFKITSSSQIGC